MNPKIIITIRGGCITNISTTSPVDVSIKDWDNLKTEEDFNPESSKYPVEIITPENSCPPVA